MKFNEFILKLRGYITWKRIILLIIILIILYFVTCYILFNNYDAYLRTQQLYDFEHPNLTI